jgi:hypothetical protein
MCIVYGLLYWQWLSRGGTCPFVFQEQQVLQLDLALAPCHHDLLPHWLWHVVLQVLGVIASGAAPHVTRVMLDNMTRRDASCPGGVDVSLLKQAVAKVLLSSVLQVAAACMCWLQLWLLDLLA